MNFVLDCNVWVSIFYRNKLEKVLNAIYAKGSNIVSCQEQFKEFADIHTKHDKISGMIPLKTEECILLMSEACELYHPAKRFTLIEDYKDNYLVDLAHQSKSILVSNDKDFDQLRKLKQPKVKVLSIKDFYHEIGI
jgi:putative PIN family toxin of toxin-antitoxin system